jgi:cytochrome bd-type quinol oxidase subunit 1
VSTWTIGLSLGVFIALYLALGVADFVLMRRYARLDPPEAGPELNELPQPVPGF